MRRYIFTEAEVERLLRWLQTGEEDPATRMLFVDVRRNLNRLSVHLELLAMVARELIRQGRWMGRATLPRDLSRRLKALGVPRGSLERGNHE